MSYGQGLAKGVAKLTGDNQKALSANASLLRLRVDCIAKVVAQQRLGISLRGYSRAKLCDMLSAQLCQWSKDSFGDTVKDVKTMLSALG